MVIVDVNVINKSHKFSISIKDGIIKIRLTSPPEKGEANSELVKELGKALGGAPIRIVSGLSSRHKRLEIGLSEEDWKAKLAILAKH